MTRTGTTGSRSPRLALRLVVTAIFFLVSVALGSAAQAVETIDCTPMGDAACKDLTAIVECVWNNGDGTRTVAWGYSNPSTKIVHIDIGNKNNMTPGADGQGQPTDFQIGTFHNVFTTTVTGTTMQWRLGNTTYTANTATPACSTKPVPVVGSVRALLVGVVLLLAAGFPLIAMRRRRMAVDA